MKPIFPLFVAAIFAPLADAATINVDCNHNSPAPASPTFTGSGVLGGGTWNAYASGLNSMNGLVDSTGLTTTVSMSLNGGTWDATDGGNTPAGLANDLLRDYRNLNNGTMILSLTGLMANTSYSVVLYGAGDQVIQGSIFAATVGTYSGTTTTTGAQRDTYAEGVNYVQGTATTNASGALTFTIAPNTAGGNPYSILNGFQISGPMVPEPSAAVLGMLGGLALLRRRRAA